MPSRGGAVDREVIQQWRMPSGDQGADQFGGEIAEGDAVAAIAVGGEQVLGAGNRADQRQAIVGRIERAGPPTIDVERSVRPERGELPRKPFGFRRHRGVARGGLDQRWIVFTAEDDPAVYGGARVVIILAVLPDQHAVLPEVLRLRGGGDGPARGHSLDLWPNDLGPDITRGEHGVAGFYLEPVVETDADRGAAAVKSSRVGFEQAGAALKREVQ